MSAAFDILIQIKSTCGIDARLDLLYKFVSDSARSGKYNDIDDVLVQITTHRVSLDTDSILGFLTATNRMRKKLKTRLEFINFCEEEFKYRGESVEALMEHLK